MISPIMRLLLIAVFLTGNAAAVQAQLTAHLETISGTVSTLPVSDYELNNGELILTSSDGKKSNYSATDYKSIDLGTNLRFRSVANTTGTTGLRQQYLDGQLVVYSNGSNSVLVIDPARNRPLDISLSDNKRELTYLLQGCERLAGAERVEAMQTNGLSRFLAAIHDYNQCVEPTTAQMYFSSEKNQLKKQIGFTADVRYSSVKNVLGSITNQETFDARVLPALGLALRLASDRARVSMEARLLYSRMVTGEDNLPVAINNTTEQDIGLTSSSLSLELLGRYRLGNGAVFNSVFIGGGPSYLFGKDLKVEARNFQYANAFVADNEVNFLIRMGVGLYQAGPLQFDLFAGGSGFRLVSGSGSPQRFVERFVGLRGTYYFVE